MLSVETPSYDMESADPRLIAFARKQFHWKDSKTYEIPVGLISGRVDDGDYLRCPNELGRLADTHADTRGLDGFLIWFTAPFPHEHVHIDYTFVHRPLRRQVVTYREVEGVLSNAHSISSTHCNPYFLIQQPI